MIMREPDSEMNFKYSTLAAVSISIILIDSLSFSRSSSATKNTATCPYSSAANTKFW